MVEWMQNMIDGKEIETGLSAMDVLPGGSMGIALPGKELLFISDGLVALTGYSRDEYAACGLDGWHRLLLHEDDRQYVAREAYRQITECGRLDIVVRMTRKDDAIIWVHLFAGCLNDPKWGKYLQCIFLDCTKTQCALLEAEQEHRDMETLIGTIPGGMAELALCDDCRIVLASDGFYRMTGYTREECQEKPFSNRAFSFVYEEDLPIVKMTLRDILEFGGPARAEFRVRRKDGSTIWVASYSSRAEQINGELVACIVFIDTTAEKNLEHRLIALTNSVPGGVARIRVEDNGLMVEFASNGFYQLAGHTVETFAKAAGLDFSRLIHPDDRERVCMQMRRFSNAEEASLSTEFRLADAPVRWMRLGSARLGERFAEGERYLECVLSDITESKNVEKQLDLNEERYRIICEQAKDILFDWDMETGAVYHSSVFLQKFGYSIPPEKALEFILRSDTVHDEDKTRLTRLMNALQAGELYGEEEYRIKHQNGNYLWCKIKASTIFDDSGKACRAVGIITDVDDYMREADRLKEKARRDLLTGLLNKMTVQDTIQECLTNSSGQRHVMFLIDIDNFKGINDHLGHSLGDAVLREISTRLREQFREEDIVGRVGGDEFVVFMENAKSESIIRQKAEVLSGIFRHSFHDCHKNYRISGSIGISVYPEHGRTFAELYQKADEAMYLSKRKGKDCFSIFQDYGPQLYAARQGAARARLPAESVLGTELAARLFDILYSAGSIDSALAEMLRITGECCHVGQVCLCERTDAGMVCGSEYHKSPEKQFYHAGQLCPWVDVEEYPQLCDEKRIFLCADTDELPIGLCKKFQPVGIRCVMQARIMKDEECSGMVAFFGRESDRYWAQNEVDAVALLARSAGGLLTKRCNEIPTDIRLQ